jgi:hypothetical protein
VQQLVFTKQGLTSLGSQLVESVPHQAATSPDRRLILREHQRINGGCFFEIALGPKAGGRNAFARQGYVVLYRTNPWARTYYFSGGGIVSTLGLDRKNTYAAAIDGFILIAERSVVQRYASSRPKGEFVTKTVLRGKLFKIASAVIKAHLDGVAVSHQWVKDLVIDLIRNGEIDHSNVSLSEIAGYAEVRLHYKMHVSNGHLVAGPKP